MDSDITSYNALRRARKVKAIREATGTATPNSVWSTLVSMTGTTGFVIVLRLSWASSTTSPQFRVTIDGGTPLTFATGGSTIPSYIDGGVNPYVVLPITNIRFNTSLLVEGNGSVSTVLAHVVWGER